MRRTNRFFAYVIIILVCFLLETTLFQKISLASIVPNLLIIVTSSIGFIRGKTEGLFIGFFCGLLKDVMSGDLLGLYALIYMMIGYLNGFFRSIFYDDDMKLPISLIAASDFVYGIMVYIFVFLLQSDFRFSYYFQHIIMAELVYTVLIAFIVYHIIHFINCKLEDNEKRSASKFV